MSILDLLNKGLVVSCQPVDDGPMDSPPIIAAMAQAAVAGGANGIRIEGVENVGVARNALSVPLIGIVKRNLESSAVRITPYLDDVRLLAKAGADIIAFDATARSRPVARADLVAEIRRLGCLAMADCSTLADAAHARELGVEIIGTTLSGYTGETASVPCEPDIELVAKFRQLGGFVMAEGRFATPQLAAAAIDAGADCVTVGTPLTRLELNTAAFRTAIHARASEDV